MKKALTLLSAIAVCGSMASVSFPASAEENLVYGTMNIPYADFYRAEFQDSSNAYEVDAVSSATTSKWKMNGEGQLFEGSYNSENEDGTGTILGVTYPVAISQADLNALGENNYSFAKADAIPSAYKSVTVADGKAEFSAVQDSTPTVFTGAAKLSTSTPWGDYLLDFENKPEDMGAIYGAIIKTTSGNRYPMRHEQNIWRGELAWSTGITTTEPHGNSLDYKDYKSMMGETIDEITFITLNGYYTVAADTYVPVKFAGSEISIENGNAGTSSTSLSVNGFPADYAKTYSIADNFAVTDDTISYTDAAAGTYTLNVSDANGKYASASASFTLTTDAMPAVYSDGKIIKAENAADEEYANYMKNISKVTVNGTDFSASGRGATKIILEDGTVDFKAESRNGAVFDGTGNYAITVNATGYNTPLEITVKAETPADTTTAAATTEKSNTTTTTAKSNSSSGNNSNSSSSNSQVASPKTGDTNAVAALGITALAMAGVAFVFRKKNK